MMYNLKLKFSPFLTVFTLLLFAYTTILAQGPTGEISSEANNPTNELLVPLKINFNEGIVDFTLQHVNVEHGYLENLRHSSSYSASFGGSDELPENQLRKPLGIAYGNNDKIYVADRENSGVRVLNIDFETIDFISSILLPNGTSALLQPVDVATDARGYIYIINEFNKTLFVIDDQFNYVVHLGIGLAPFGEPFIEPRAVTVGPSGKIYISDYGNNSVQVFNNDFTLYGIIGRLPGSSDAVTNPTGVAIGSDGKIYVAQDQSIKIFNPDLSFSESIDGQILSNTGGFIDNPSQLSIDNQDRLYWVMRQQIIVIENQNGYVVTNVITDDDPSVTFVKLFDVLFLPNGQVLAVDEEANLVHTYNSKVAFEADLILQSEGEERVTIFAGDISNLSGETNSQNIEFTINLDTDPPVPMLEAQTPAGGAFTVDITFNEPVEDFTIEDITVNGDLSDFQGTGDAYSVIVTPLVDGSVHFVIASGAALDLAGNLSQGADLRIEADLTPPNTTVNLNSASPTNEEIIVFEILFSEEVYEFQQSDLSVTGGVIKTINVVNDPTVSVIVEVEPVVDGPVELTVPAGIAHDLAGNPSTAASGAGISDRTPPTVVLALPGGSNTNESEVLLDITFSEPVVGFTIQDITVNGDLSDFQGAGDTYSVIVTPLVDGSVHFVIASGAAFDLAGNPNQGANLRIEADLTPPNTTVTLNSASPTNEEIIVFEILFSEEVYEFQQSDLSVTGGVITTINVVNDPTVNVIVEVEPAVDGPVELTVPAGIAHDLAGNPSTAASGAGISDRTPPTVVLTLPGGSNTNESEVLLDITFSEPVVGFGASDLRGNMSSTRSFTEISSTYYQVYLRNSSEGEKFVQIENGVRDIAGNDILASNTISYTYDTTRPQINITSTETSPTNSKNIPISIQSTKKLESLTLEDFIVVGGSLTNFVGLESEILTGFSYSAILTPQADGEISVTISENSVADLAGNLNEASQFSITAITTGPSVIISSSAVNIITSATWEVIVDFSEDITGFEVGDIETTNCDVVNLVALSPSQYAVTVGNYLDGDISILVPAESVIDTEGNQNSASNLLELVADITLPTASLTLLTPTPTSLTEAVILITLSEQIDGLSADNLNITNGNLIGNDQSGLNYEVRIQLAPDEIMTFEIPSGGIGDLAGNTNAESYSLEVRSDQTRPVPVITSDIVGPYSQGMVIPLTITFSEPVSGLELSDFNISGALLKDLSGSGQVYAVNLLPAVLGPVNMILPENSVVDEVGLGNSVSEQFAISIRDNKRPVPTITTVEPNRTNAEYLAFEISFDEEVNEFTADDLDISNGIIEDGKTDEYTEYRETSVFNTTNTISMVVNSHNEIITVSGSDQTVRKYVDGQITQTIGSGIIGDGIGEFNDAIDIAIDNEDNIYICDTNNNRIQIYDRGFNYIDQIALPESPLAVHIGFDNKLYVLLASIQIVYIYEADRRSFSVLEDDFSLARDIATDIDGNIYVLERNLKEILIYDSSLNQKATLQDWNDNGVSESFGLLGFLDVDRQGTIYVQHRSDDLGVLIFDKNLQYLSTIDTDVTIPLNVPKKVYFDNKTDHLYIELQGDVYQYKYASGYQVEVSPLSDGEVTVQVPENITTDLYGNPNVASNSITLVSDRTSPTVEISQNFSANGSSELNIDFIFSESVLDFSVEDIELSAGFVDGFTQEGDLATAKIDITGVSHAVVITVPENSFTDLVGNLNSSSSLTIDVDVEGPIPTLISSGPNPTRESPFPLEVSFNEEVTGFDIDDLVVTNGEVLDHTDVYEFDNTFLDGSQAIDGISLSRPTGLYVAADGRVYVPQSSSHRVWVFESDGSLVTTIGGTVGASNDQFNNPRDVSVDANGRIYVCDLGNQRIQIFNPDFSYYGTINTLELVPDSGISQPVYITHDNDGMMYVTDVLSSVILIFNPDLSLEATLGAETSIGNENYNFHSPAGVAVTDDRIYVADLSNHRVQVFDKSLDYLSTLGIGVQGSGEGEFTQPRGIVVDAEGNILVSDKFRVQIFRPDLSYVTTIADANDELDAVSDVSFGPDGKLYASEFRNNRIQVFQKIKVESLVVQPHSNGAVTISLPASRVHDLSGNENVAAVPLTIIYDTIRPDVTITAETIDPSLPGILPITFTFTKPVVGFQEEDVTLIGGSLLSFDGGGSTYTAEVNVVGSAQVTITLEEGIATDNIGNESTFQTVSVDLDAERPTVEVSSSILDPTNSEFIEVSVSFSEPVIEFSSRDIVTTGISGVSTEWDGQVLTMTLRLIEGIATVQVPENITTDFSGNLNEASNLFEITYDKTGPIPVLTTEESDPSGSDPIVINLYSAESLQSLRPDRFLVTNGSITNVSQLGPNYSIEITPLMEGTVTLEIPGNSIYDLADNGNSVNGVISLNSQTQRPKVVLSSTEPGVTGNTGIIVNVDFSEPISGLILEDFSTLNASLSNLQTIVPGRQYSIQVQPSTPGIVVLNLDENRVSDVSGAGNEKSNFLQFEYSGPYFSSIGFTSIVVSWLPVDGATGYQIYVNGDFGIPNRVLVINAAADATSVHIGTLQLRKYVVRVRPIIPGRVIPYSASISTFSKSLPPEVLPPADVRSNSFNISCEYDSNADNYYFDLSIDPGFNSFVEGYENLQNGSRVFLGGLTAGQTYYYRFRVEGGAFISESSDVETITLIPPPPVALAPTNVRANGFTINWNASLGADSYFVEVYRNRTLSYSTTVSTGLLLVTTPNNYFPGDFINYSVKAINDAGESNASNSISFTIPTAPARPIRFFSDNVTDRSFQLSWSPDDSYFVLPEGYIVEVAENSGFSVGLKTRVLDANTTNYTFTGLRSDRTYHARVMATNVIGVSQAVTRTVKTLLSPPYNIEFSNITKSTFVMTWQTPGYNNIEYDLATDELFENIVEGYEDRGAANSSTSISGLELNTAYFLRLRQPGNDLNSAVNSVTTLPARLVPPVVSNPFNVTHNEFSFDWIPVDGATNYFVQISNSEEFPSGSSTFQIIQSETSITRLILPQFRTYYYRVASRNAGGTGDFSTPIEFVSLPTKPVVEVLRALGNIIQLENISSLGATSLRLDVSTSEDFSSFVGPYEDFVTDGQNIRIEGLLGDTEYFIRARGVNATGTTDDSSIVPSRTLLELSIPTGLAFTEIENRVFTVIWDRHPTTHNYRLEVASDPEFEDITDAVNTSFSNPDISPSYVVAKRKRSGTIYYARLSARRGGIDMSVYSEASVVTIPGTRKAFTQNITENSIDIFWSLDPSEVVEGTLVDVARDILFEDLVVDARTVSETSTLVSNLDPDTQYYIRLRVFNSSGVSSASSTTTANTLPDIMSPSVVISSTEKELTNANPIRIQIEFDEEVMGFETEDIVVSNGTVEKLIETITTTAYDQSISLHAYVEDFGTPKDIGVAASGETTVLFDKAVIVLDASGDLLHTFDRSAVEGAAVYKAIGFDADGNRYLAGFTPSAIDIYDVSNNSYTQLTVSGPSDDVLRSQATILDLNSAGDVYVFDDYADRILIYDAYPSLAYSSVIRDENTIDLVDIEINAADRLYLATSHSIRIYDDGSEEVSEFAFPNEGENVRELTSWSEGGNVNEFQAITSIASDAQGNLYVTDAILGKVLVFSSALEFITSIDINMATEGPQSFFPSHVDIEGGLMHLIQGGNEIQVFHAQQTYVADIAPLVDGLVTINIPASVATDLSGNPNNESETFTISSDTTLPTLQFSSVVSENQADVTIRLSEVLADFEDGGFEAANGSINSISIAEDGLSIILNLTSTGGRTTLNVLQGTIYDLAGNENEEASYLIPFDVEQPEAILSLISAEVTNDIPITIGVSFSEEITGLEIDDFTISNGRMIKIHSPGLANDFQDAFSVNEVTNIFNVPRDLLVDVNNNVLIAHIQGVSVFNSEGNFLRRLSTGTRFAGASYLAIDLEGNIYVSDGRAKQVYIFDPEYNFLSSFALPPQDQFASTPSALATNAEGNILVLDQTGYRVIEYSPYPGISPVNTLRLPQEGRVNSIDVAINGDLLILRPTVLNVYDSESQQIKSSFSGWDDNGTTRTLSGAIGLSVDMNGHVYLSDNGIPRVVVLDPELNVVGEISRDFSGAFDSRFTPFESFYKDGELYLLEDRYEVHRFSSNDFYVAEVLPQLQGEIIIELPENSVEDFNGNGNSASEPISVVFDSRRPEIDSSIETFGNEVLVTLSINEPVIGFDLSDLVVTKASILDFQALSRAVYQVKFGSIEEGALLSLRSESFTDVAGNANSNFGVRLPFDLTPPQIAVTSAVQNNEIVLQIVVNEPISSFVEDQIGSIDGTINSLQQISEDTWELNYHVEGSNPTLNFAEGAFTDLAGNESEVYDFIIVDRLSTVMINGQHEEVTSFSTNQDNGAYEIYNGGHTILLTGNAWKSAAFSYNVTAKTIVEFDFESDDDGEIQGIMFTDPKLQQNDNIFQVSGEQSLGRQDYHDYAGTETKHYKVWLGEYINGAINHVTFIGDEDRVGESQNARFSNIVISEDNSQVPLAPAGLMAIGISFDIVSLEWIDNSNNETTFSIERSTTIAGDFTKIASVSANTTTYIDQSVVASTTYFYRVRAMNVTVSSESAPAEVTTTTAPKFIINEQPVALSPFDDIRDNGQYTVSADEKTLKLTGNAWKTADFNYTITPQSVMTFEFRSIGEGEIQGIMLTEDRSFDETRLFQLLGIQKAGYQHFKDYKGNDWVQYSIRLSDFFEGEFNHITFVGDDDRDDPSQQSKYRNFTIYEDPLISPDKLQINSSAVDVRTFSSNQDKGAYALEDAGRAIRLDGNTWKSAAFSYNVTPKTVIEFDFESDDDGEVQGLMFTEVKLKQNDNIFQVSGEQNLGRQDYHDYVGTETKHYEIWLGEYINGPINYVTFIGDEDRAGETQSARFSNIVLREDDSQAPVAPTNLIATGLSFDIVSLEWVDNSNNETSFSIERSTDIAGEFTKFASLPANTTAYIDQSAEANATYFYRVKATNVSVNSGDASTQITTAVAPKFIINGQPTAVSPFNDIRDNGKYIVSADESTLRLTGNAWKTADFNYTITPQSVMTFEFRSMGEGEIQGIMLTEDRSFDQTRLFQLLGIQKAGYQHYKNYEGNDWIQYSILLSDFFEGEFNHITFVADDDRDAPGQDSEYRNFTIYEDASRSVDKLQINSSAVDVRTFSSKQDKGEYTVEDAGRTIRLDGNAWKTAIFEYDVTLNTILEFDFKSEDEGEIQGVMLTKNKAQENIFQLYGSQTIGVQDFNNYSGSDWKHYKIPLGDFISGKIDYFTFLGDEDRTGASQVSSFRDIVIYEDGNHTQARVTEEAEAFSSGDLSDELAVTKITLFPNPMSNQVRVILSEPQESTPQFNFYDLGGRALDLQIVQYSSEEFVLIPEIIPTGVYMLSITFEKGETQFIRVLKQ